MKRVLRIIKEMNVVAHNGSHAFMCLLNFHAIISQANKIGIYYAFCFNPLDIIGERRRKWQKKYMLKDMTEIPQNAKRKKSLEMPTNLTRNI